MVVEDGSDSLRERAAIYFILPITPLPLRDVAAIKAMLMVCIFPESDL